MPQPHLRRQQISLHCGSGNLLSLGNFIDREPTEIAQNHDLGLTSVQFPQIVESLMKSQNIDILLAAGHDDLG